MGRGLITRDFSMEYVADQGSTDAVPVQRRHDVVGARGLDPAVGLILAGFTVAVAHRSSAHR